MEAGSGSTASTSVETTSISRVVILGEIVGATNLAAALRDDPYVHGEASPPTSGKEKERLVNAYCDVHFGEDRIHRTKIIPKNNNPIWACDTGSLFKIELDIGQEIHERICKDLKIEVFNKSKKVRKQKITSLGIAIIEAENIITGKICNEERMTFDLCRNRANVLKHMKSKSRYLGNLDLWNSIESLTPALQLLWPDKDKDVPQEDEESVDGEDSIYGNNPDENDHENNHNHDDDDDDDDKSFDPDDDFLFGDKGTIALRFRIATTEDMDFLKAVETYNDGFQYAKRKNKLALQKVSHMMNVSVQRIQQVATTKVQVVSENSTSYNQGLNCEMMNELIDHRIRGKVVDDRGVYRFKVKPGPDPDPQNEQDTKFMTEEQMRTKCCKPSHAWVEAGSGSIGQIKLEILSCQGLPNKDFGQMFGNKTDPFVCIVYEDCLVKTDMILDCLSPMWMPWTQRAFLFNRMHEVSSIHIGVFNHMFGPITKHTGCGRVTIDLKEFKPNTVYTLKYELFSSPTMTERKSKGIITIRLQLTDFEKVKSVKLLRNPPVIHVNVKRRKTLDIARYTCYGKYREDVYHTKILKSYVDEILENIEITSFEVKQLLQSLLFWQGQVQVGSIYIPLHSFLAFTTATYVIDRPHQIPAYIFFCGAWGMLTLMNRHHADPYPWSKKSSFSYHLKNCLLLPRFIKGSSSVKGETIDEGQGFQERKECDERRRKIMEEDKKLNSKINNMKRDLEAILLAVSEVNLDTSDSVGLNPFSRLLPIQLMLRDIIHYVRWMKRILCCKDSQLSFFIAISSMLISSILFIVPITKIMHFLTKIIIWVFLGPWMRLVDMVYKRKKSTEVRRQLDRVIEEMQEREQKRFTDARKLREEAIKVRATRILRFGRFAVKVPSVNVTRYYDYPLPESTARPLQNDGKTNDEKVVKYVPGQKDYGVMIPELTKPTKMRIHDKEVRQARVKELKSLFENQRKELNSICYTEATHRSIDDNPEKLKNKPVVVEVNSELSTEGFELFPAKSLRQISSINTNKWNPLPHTPEEREGHDTEEDFTMDERDLFVSRQRKLGMGIDHKMSDLTFD